jgi:hypothetical protein
LGSNPADDAPDSPFGARTELLQRHVREILDSFRAGALLRIVSVCAGEAQRVIPVIAAHPRRADVRARLVEHDPRNVAAACELVGRLRLDWSVEIVCADASVTDAYAGAVPADLLLLCGVFGRLTLEDVRNTIQHLPELCAPGAVALWTHPRREPNPTTEIRAFFARTGFREDAFESASREASWVGVHRFDGPARPLIRGARLFTYQARHATKRP